MDSQNKFMLNENMSEDELMNTEKSSSITQATFDEINNALTRSKNEPIVDINDLVKYAADGLFDMKRGKRFRVITAKLQRQILADTGYKNYSKLNFSASPSLSEVTRDVVLKLDSIREDLGVKSKSMFDPQRCRIDATDKYSLSELKTLAKTREIYVESNADQDSLCQKLTKHWMDFKSAALRDILNNTPCATLDRTRLISVAKSYGVFESSEQSNQEICKSLSRKLIDLMLTARAQEFGLGQISTEVIDDIMNAQFDIVSADITLQQRLAILMVMSKINRNLLQFVAVSDPNDPRLSEVEQIDLARRMRNEFDIAQRFLSSVDEKDAFTEDEVESLTSQLISEFNQQEQEDEQVSTKNAFDEGLVPETDFLTELENITTQEGDTFKILTAAMRAAKIPITGSETGDLLFAPTDEVFRWVLETFKLTSEQLLAYPRLKDLILLHGPYDYGLVDGDSITTFISPTENKSIVYDPQKMLIDNVPIIEEITTSGRVIIFSIDGIIAVQSILDDLKALKDLKPVKIAKTISETCKDFLDSANTNIEFISEIESQLDVFDVEFKDFAAQIVEKYNINLDINNNFDLQATCRNILGLLDGSIEAELDEQFSIEEEVEIEEDDSENEDMLYTWAALQTEEDASTFVALGDEIGFDDFLNENATSELYVLVPTKAAFSKFFDKVDFDTIRDVDGIDDFLRGHLTETVPEDIIYTTNGGYKFIDEVIYEVPVEEVETQSDLIETLRQKYTNLTRLIEISGLASSLNDILPITILAPNDEALNPIMGEVSASPDLADILRSHIISGLLNKNDIIGNSQNKINTVVFLDGTKRVGNKIPFGSSTNLAENFIVHEITEVLDMEMGDQVIAKEVFPVAKDKEEETEIYVESEPTFDLVFQDVDLSVTENILEQLSDPTDPLQNMITYIKNLPEVVVYVPTNDAWLQYFDFDELVFESYDDKIGTLISTIDEMLANDNEKVLNIIINHIKLEMSDPEVEIKEEINISNGKVYKTDLVIANKQLEMEAVEESESDELDDLLNMKLASFKGQDLID